MFIISKAFLRYRLYSLYQNCHGILHRLRTYSTKICLEPQQTQIAKSLLRKNRVQGIRSPQCKLHCKAIIIKIVCCWYKDRHRDDWNREPINKPTHIIIN